MVVSVPEWRQAIDAWLPQGMEQLSVLLEQQWDLLFGGVVVAVIGLALLLVELRTQRAASQLLLREDSAGEVTILVDSTRRLVDHVAERIPNVKEAQALVLPTPKGLRVRCRVTVDPAANVPELAREVQSQIGAALYDGYRHQHLLNSEVMVSIALGFTAAFVSALLVVRALVRFVAAHSFAVFAWYRIALGALILALAGVHSAG